MLRGDKGVSYDDVVRQLTPDERLQAAEFFREQAKIAKTPVQKLFNAERANFIERGGPQPPGNLAEFKARHGFEGID